MKPFLIIGRAWKFVEFMTPTVESVYEFHDRKDFDFVVLENKSSRSRSVRSYISQLLRGNLIDGAVLADGNYWSHVFQSVQLFKQKLLNYENIIFTDMDLNVYGHSNWLFDLKQILDSRQEVGAISIDVKEFAPYSDGFIFCKDLTEHPTIKGFYQSPIDLGFYMVRSSEFVKYNTLPGSHGYNSIVSSNGQLLGKVNIVADHYGWLRSTPEYRESYSETGIVFGGNIQQDNGNYYAKQCVTHNVSVGNFNFIGPFFNEG